MSRSRIVNAIRTNEDYKVVTGILDDLIARGVDLSYRVEAATGHAGHPKVFVSYGGKESAFTLTSTPRNIVKGLVARRFKSFLHEKLATVD